MTVLAGTFIVVLLLVNLLLKLTVVNPIQDMSRTANAVSQGKSGAPEFKSKGTGELAVLAASFNRMRRSLDKAMTMLNDGKG